MEDETPTSTIFIPPSIKDHTTSLLSGTSYEHYSPIPTNITPNIQSTPPTEGTPCVLGVDEAGRGPVIGPMVYGIFYLPIELQHSLLASTHHFDDSKVLTPAVRASLFKSVCSSGTDLYENCGWAISSLSARSISAAMLRNRGPYNLNAQAMDATISLIRHNIDMGVNVREIYVDTIGIPAVYQKKLERIFPTIKIVVEKKADSLYPVVSAASVVAKVSRDVSCERLYEEYARMMSIEGGEVGWGSGYPSDARCVSWLKGAIDPVFGWGSECRFSWGTAKDMLEAKGSAGTRVDWPTAGDEENMQLSQYFGSGGSAGPKTEAEELRTWFGSSVGQEVF